MRWLKHLIPIGLVVAAVAIAISTGLSDHQSDYGSVTLPEGGTLQLPEGELVIFYDEPGRDKNTIEQVPVPVSFQVVPAGGGAPLALASADGGPALSSVQRSETIGELGAVAKLEVPRAGLYTVSGQSGREAGVSSLSFGTNAGAALKD